MTQSNIDAKPSLFVYQIYQRRIGGMRWWKWPYSSFFKTRTINFAKRLREAADGKYEYKIKKVEVK